MFAEPTAGCEPGSSDPSRRASAIVCVGDRRWTGAFAGTVLASQLIGTGGTAYRELLKFGFEVAQSTVAKYMVRRRGPPSQGRKTFLRNHAPDIGAIDMFVVPTIGLRLL